MPGPLNSRPLDGKVVLVTGASRGIGAAAAIRLAQGGAAVVVNYHQNKDAAEKVLSEVRSAGARGMVFQADVTQKDQIDKMVQAIEQQLGSIHVLVNNAYFPFEVGPLHALSWENFHRAVEQGIDVGERRRRRQQE